MTSFNICTMVNLQFGFFSTPIVLWRNVILPRAVNTAITVLSIVFVLKKFWSSEIISLFLSMAKVFYVFI